MTIRHVRLYKLEEEHSDADGRRVVAEALASALLESSRPAAVAVGLPADPHAEKSWDLVATLDFDELETVDAHFADPRVLEAIRAALEGKVLVEKAWSFVSLP